MDDYSQVTLKTLKTRSQDVLIQFLNTDLDLAFTMLRTAQIEAQFDPEAFPDAMQRVQDALRTVRSFVGRVEERNVWSRILSRSDELEASIAEVSDGWKQTTRRTPHPQR